MRDVLHVRLNPGEIDGDRGLLQAAHEGPFQRGGAGLSNRLMNSTICATLPARFAPSCSKETSKMPASYAPDPKMKFTFGLWTVGNIGRDPFGGPVREPLSPPQICDLLGDV